MPSGRKRQGKSLLLAAVGEESPHRQRPWALLSPLQDAKLLQLQVATRGAFSSCHPVALSKGLQSWGRFLAMGLIAPDVHRWLKFEEDVEDGGERWSKPYVGTLSLHSLSELRSCISNGTVLLDVCANSIEEIADMILAQQEQSTEFDEHMRAQVREVLLRKHHHQNEKTTNLLPVVCSFADECRYLHGEFQGPACGRDGPYTPDVFFWCCILFFATFALSSFLKKFKTSRYFPTRVRSTVSDFAVFLTIVIMVLLDFVVGIPSPKLHVPHAFKPTRDDRGWFINPIGPNPWWTVLAALVPALLCTILIFMDQQISAVIVNRKEHKLKKGCGYHLDLFMVAVMLGVCSVMGLPWFVAATVLSITHVNSLKVESDCSAPGEQPKFLGIREQRVTGLLIFALMGCSVFFTSVLKFIPMPVLYGVFLYMGVSLLRGIQVRTLLQRAACRLPALSGNAANLLNA
ncbi:electroneutral sodium bicarbonate exchanger 1-like [Morphnus guianensis]